MENHHFGPLSANSTTVKHSVLTVNPPIHPGFLWIPHQQQPVEQVATFIFAPNLRGVKCHFVQLVAWWLGKWLASIGCTATSWSLSPRISWTFCWQIIGFSKWDVHPNQWIPHQIIHWLSERRLLPQKPSASWKHGESWRGACGVLTERIPEVKDQALPKWDQSRYHNQKLLL